MVLECLPCKVPESHERKSFGWIRYALFAASFLFVGALLLLQVPNVDRIMLYAFIGGTIAYYAVGIALAFAFRDNRAFYKYICPITVFLKVGASRSLMRIRVDEDKCVHCGKCIATCPMDVEVPSNSWRKRNASECILCLSCVDACPEKALHL